MATRSQVHPLPFDLPRVNGNHWEGLLEVFQAFHRWQNSYSPASLLKQEFFRRPAQGLCSLHRDYPPHKHLLLQRALPACLPGWQQTVAVGFRSQGPGEVPLQHVVLPSGPETWEAVLDDAHLGFEGPEGKRLMVRVNLELWREAIDLSKDRYHHTCKYGKFYGEAHQPMLRPGPVK